MQEHSDQAHLGHGDYTAGYMREHYAVREDQSSDCRYGVLSIEINPRPHRSMGNPYWPVFTRFVRLDSDPACGVAVPKAARGGSVVAFTVLSECFQICNQGGFVFGGQLQSKLVTRNCAGLDVVTPESRRYIILAQPPRIEPVFKRRNRAAMLEHIPVPHATERRDFVISRSPPGIHRQVRIGADRNLKDIVLLKMIFRDLKAWRR